MRFLRLTFAQAASLAVALMLALGGFALGAAPSAAQSAGPGTFAPGPGAGSTNTYSGRIEAPAANAMIPQSQTLLVTGWACDTTAQGWAGFDQVQVYTGAMGSGGTMLASGSVGGTRSDVAGTTGDPNCAPSGFSVTVPGSALGAAGAMTLNVYLHTPGNGWWYLSVPVTVAAGAPSTSGTPASGGTSSGSSAIAPGCPGASKAATPVPAAAPGVTPTIIATSLCTTLPFSPDVHVTIIAPMSSDVLQEQTSQTLSGIAYDDRAPSGQSGISQVQVYLNGLAGNNGTLLLGTATLGSGGGFQAPRGTNANNEFFFQFNPGITPGSNPNVPWPTGGNVLYVYAYGMNGAVTAVSAPFNLIS